MSLENFEQNQTTPDASWANHEVLGSNSPKQLDTNIKLTEKANDGELPIVCIGCSEVKQTLEGLLADKPLPPLSPAAQDRIFQNVLERIGRDSKP